MFMEEKCLQQVAPKPLSHRWHMAFVQCTAAWHVLVKLQRGTPGQHQDLTTFVLRCIQDMK
jgi:hypothetical protein